VGSNRIDPDPRDVPGADPDAERMLRFQRGDEQAFAALVKSHQGRVVSLAYRYLGSAHDAEDVAQEVFLRVYRAKETYEPAAKFSTWLYRIAANASLNHLRGRKARRRVATAMPSPEAAPEPADENAPAPGERLEKEELARVLRRIVDELPERQRMAIVLNKYDGLSYEEVAAALEMSVMAVKSLLTRARVNVKERLLPYLNEGAIDALEARDP
jgi:RNA polymerase sigma-70 factor, ECF subfamily